MSVDISGIFYDKYHQALYCFAKAVAFVLKSIEKDNSKNLL